MNNFNKFIKIYKENNDSINILNNYIESKTFIKDLYNLLDDDKLLLEVANRSTIHTNKFAKIVLANYLGYKLRLHIWPIMKVNQYHEPHNHRWNFNSYVLNGIMVNRIMEESLNEEDELSLYCKSMPMKVGSKREYVIQEPKRLAKIKDEIIEKGYSYHMNHNTIHIAKIPKNTLTATLFITSPAEKEFSDLYMPDMKNPPCDVKLSTLTVNELKEKIDLIKKFKG